MRQGAVLLRMQLKGAREVREAVMLLDRTTRKRLDQQIDKSASSIQTDARALAPKDTGLMAASITVERMKRRPYRGKAVNVSDKAFYSPWVEFGSWLPNAMLKRPRRHKFPTTAADSRLAGWATSHGLPLGAIAAEIAEKGVQPEPFLGPAYEDERPRFYAAVERIVFRDAPRVVQTKYFKLK